MSKCPLIAKAIVYAVRQAQLINQYGMTWEAIEVNTANILAGCSIPADGKMNSAEAVSNSIMGRLRTQADTPPNRNVFASHPCPWTLRNWHNRARSTLVDDNGRIVGNIRNERVAQKMVDLVNGTKDEHAQGIISRQIASLQRIKGERDEARAELSLARASQDKLRQEALANKVERDDFAQKWATLRASMIPQPNHVRLAELEARNVELRQMLEQSQQDRDGFRRGAQFWMDSSNDRKTERDKAEAKVVKLRTFLERKWCNVCSCDTEAIGTILEETK